MLKRRLIPKLQLKTSRFGDPPPLVLVTTLRFGDFVEIGDPVSQAKIYEAQAADELIFLDLDASRENRKTLINIIRHVTEEIFMPITVGGGVKNKADFRTLLASGADKISINTAAVENPDLINTAADAFGSQCVVMSIDYRETNGKDQRVYIKGGTVETDLDPVAWALEGEKRGAGEILLTSIARDGTRTGLDIKTIQNIVEHVSIPVVASGGCGLTRHFIEGFLEGKADAVSAGTYFCFKDENPMQTRSQISNAGIPIRLHC